MAAFRQLPRAWYAAAGISIAALGCTTTPKNPLASKSSEPASTAVSGSGDFASNEGPKDPARIHLAYGQWQEQMGQQAEARESYSKVLADQPKNIDALLGMARVDQSGGLLHDAEERLKKAQKLAPKDARVLASFGNFYAARGDWAKAVESQQAAVEAAPNDPRYQFLLGVALARSGDSQAAFPYFVRSVGDAQAHYNLGLILNELGDRAGSMEHIEQALALKPDLAPAQAMFERLQQRASQPVFAGGSQRTDIGATPTSAVRTIPLSTQDDLVPLRGNEASLPRAGSRVAYPQQNAGPQPPAGLTPAQQEQWRNQQGQ
jgi:tetratricopeptide (TPR) repeat protein